MTAPWARGEGREVRRAGPVEDRLVEVLVDSHELLVVQLVGSPAVHLEVSGRGQGSRQGKVRVVEDHEEELGVFLQELPGHWVYPACLPCSSVKASTWSWSSGWKAAFPSRHVCRHGGHRSSGRSWLHPRRPQHPQPDRRRSCLRCRSHVRIYVAPTPASVSLLQPRRLGLMI